MRAQSDGRVPDVHRRERVTAPPQSLVGNDFDGVLVVVVFLLVGVMLPQRHRTQFLHRFERSERVLRGRRGGADQREVERAVEKAQAHYLLLIVVVVVVAILSLSLSFSLSLSLSLSLSSGSSCLFELLLPVSYLLLS